MRYNWLRNICKGNFYDLPKCNWDNAEGVFVTSVDVN